MTATTGMLALGRTVATVSAVAAMKENGVEPADLLARHRKGDWGELDAEDRSVNVRAVIDGERVLSNYPLPDGRRVWVITEAGRRLTTMLLPEEY